MSTQLEEICATLDKIGVHHVVRLSHDGSKFLFLCTELRKPWFVVDDIQWLIENYDHLTFKPDGSVIIYGEDR